MPFAQTVALKYQYFNDFVSELSDNISPGGMFIRTVNPRPPGSVFEFEFRLGDDFTLIEGRGEVMWVRRAGQAGSEPSGMGVRFLELEPESRAVIERIVAQHRERGESVFDLERDAPRSQELQPEAVASAEPADAEEPAPAEPIPEETIPAGRPGSEAVEAAQAELAALRAELEAAGETAREARRAAESSASEVEALRCAAEEARTEAESRAEEASAARERLETRVRETTAARDEADARAAELEGKLGAAEDSIRELEAERADLERRLEEVRQSGAESRRRNEELAPRLEEAIAALALAESKLGAAMAGQEGLSEKLHGVEQSLAASEDRLSEARAEVEALRERLSELEPRLEASESARHEAEETAVELQARLDRAEGELGRLRGEAADAESAGGERIRELEALLATSESARQKSEEAESALRRQVRELRAALAGAESEARGAPPAEARSPFDAGGDVLHIDEHDLAAPGTVTGDRTAEDATAEALPVAGAGAPKAGGLRSRRGSWPRAAALILLGAAVGAGGAYLWPGGPRPAAPPVESETAVAAVGEPAGARPASGAPERTAPSERPSEPAAAEPSEAAPTGAPPRPQRVPRAPDPDVVERAVRAWASAWSAQRVDDYLAAYAADFQPGDGSSRARWAESRRSRIRGPGSIEVTVADLMIEFPAPERAVATFVQGYRSDTYGDSVRKRLDLVREAGGWKIAAESTL